MHIGEPGEWRARGWPAIHRQLPGNSRGTIAASTAANIPVFKHAYYQRHHCLHDCQVRPFEFEGVLFHSCEQAYQAYKYPVDSPGRARICAVVPIEGEDDSAYALRVRQASHSGNGSDGNDKIRDDWNQVKVNTYKFNRCEPRDPGLTTTPPQSQVGVMYAVNKAKFNAHPDLAESLMATYPYEIRGSPSTSWTYMVRSTPRPTGSLVR